MYDAPRLAVMHVHSVKYAGIGWPTRADSIAPAALKRPAARAEGVARVAGSRRKAPP
jgi:hypothetical protein